MASTLISNYFEIEAFSYIYFTLNLSFILTIIASLLVLHLQQIVRYTSINFVEQEPVKVGFRCNYISVNLFTITEL